VLRELSRKEALSPSGRKHGVLKGESSVLEKESFVSAYLKVPFCCSPSQSTKNSSGPGVKKLIDVTRRRD
jgi:hypothetical protein